MKGVKIVSLQDRTLREYMLHTKWYVRRRHMCEKGRKMRFGNTKELNERMKRDKRRRKEREEREREERRTGGLC